MCWQNGLGVRPPGPAHWALPPHLSSHGKLEKAMPPVAAATPSAVSPGSGSHVCRDEPPAPAAGTLRSATCSCDALPGLLGWRPSDRRPPRHLPGSVAWILV